MTILESTPFLGMFFHPGTIDSAAAEILDSGGQRFRYVVTPNVYHVVQFHEESEALQSKYAEAWRVYCDSRILSYLARISGCKLSVVTGSDLTATLVARASERGLKIAIVGPSASDCAKLAARYPGLQITSYTPPMGFIKSETEVQKCIDFVVASHAPLTFLAVGTPQQEILAHALSKNSEAKGVALCIGASIDFLTGKQHRAPLFVQRAGLEWLHRLLSDPKRLAKRYLVECPRILPLVITHLRDSRSGS